MNIQLVSQNEKTFTVRANGQQMIIAKTPGNAKLLASLQDTMGKDPKGKVPGKAPVKGDSSKNDVVNINVSGGEGIIKRTAMETREKAIAFVNQMFDKQEMATGNKLNKGGKAPCYDAGGIVDVAKDEKDVDDDDEADDEEFTKAKEPTSVTANNYAGGKVAMPKGYADGSDGIEDPNAEFYAENAAPAAPEMPAVTAPPTLLTQDNASFTLSDGRTLPKNFDDPSIMQTYNQAAAASEAMAPKAAAIPAVAAPMNPNAGIVSGNDSPDQQGVGVPQMPQIDPATGKVADLKSETSTFKTTSKEARQDKASATEAQIKAAEAGYSVEEQKANLIAKVAENHALEIAKQNEAIKNRFAAQQQEVRRINDEAKKVEQEAMDARIKGDHLWGDQGTGNRIMAGIGLALGGFGQAFNGKDNPAIDIINKALDRDIEVQKANAAQLGKAATMKNNQFARMKEIYGDDNIAANAVKAMTLEQTANQIDVIKARSAAPEAKAKLEQIGANFRADAADKKMQIDQFTSMKAEKQVPIKGKPLGAEQDKEHRGDNAVLSKLNEIEKLKQEVNTGKISGNMYKLAAAMGVPLESVTDSALLQQKAAELTAKLGRQMFGNMSENERSYAEQIVPGITTDDEIFNAKIGALKSDYTKKIKADADTWRRSGYDVPDVPMDSGGMASQYGAKKKVK